MKVAIHQPTYIPYLGFFSKALASDALIIFDTAQYNARSIHNRQKIRTAEGTQLLTIPLESKATPFRETNINYTPHNKKVWYEKHWESIEFNYKKTPHFARFKDELLHLYTTSHPSTLGDFNLRLIRFMLEQFGIRRKVLLFSELNINHHLPASEKLAIAVNMLGGHEYLSGPSGKKYMQMEPFQERGLRVSFNDFVHPVYEQYHARYDQQFVLNITALDALFNLGRLPLSREVVPPLFPRTVYHA